MTMSNILIEVLETDTNLFEYYGYHHQTIFWYDRAGIIADLDTHNHGEEISDVDEKKIETTNEYQQIE